MQVVTIQHDLKELDIYDQSKWSIISDKTHRYAVCTCLTWQVSRLYSVNAVLFLKNPFAPLNQHHFPVQIAVLLPLQIPSVCR